jgi:integrase
MPARSSNPDQFLQKVGGTFYARVRVPRTLEKVVGQTHLRKSLQTGNKAEANRRKHAVVAQLKAELDKLAKTPGGPAKAGMTFADAREWREELKALEEAGKHDDAETLESLAVDRAEEVERLYGHERARRWFRAATTSNETLSELMGKWLEVSDYKEQTKAAHRKALEELLSFIKDPEALPADVTLKVAVSYIDKDLTQRGASVSTIRGRLVSLGGFWTWMSTRGAVPQGMNPWARHKVSKAQNPTKTPPKRTYTPGELVTLLKGNQDVKGWPTYAYLPDLIILGLFCGARIEELCARRVSEVELTKDRAIVRVTDSKTKAGVRFVAFVHPAPLAVLQRRTKGRAPGDLLFPEMNPGGMDDKLSVSASKAFGRYRRACSVPDGTDFHSFRRNVVTALEAAKVDQVSIARFVGHKVGTMAADVYSAGGTRETATETAQKLRYPQEVEAAALALVGA